MIHFLRSASGLSDFGPHLGRVELAVLLCSGERTQAHGAGFGNPNSEFTANFLGKANVLPARVMMGAPEGGLCTVETPCGTFSCPAVEWADAGKHGLVVFRPEGLELLQTEPNGPNVIRGTVREASFIGDVVEYGIEVEGRSAQLRAKGDPYSAAEEGATVWLQLAPRRCLLIPADDAAVAEQISAPVAG